MEELAEVLKENEKLKERIKVLEDMLHRGSTGNCSAYNTIREMIIGKVQKEINVPEGLEEWKKKDMTQRAERQIMRDLKWDLRVRTISDFRVEHIEPAKEYIEKYVIPENLKKSRWSK